MKSKLITYLIYGIGILAILGVMVSIFNNPLRLILNIIFTIAVVFLVYQITRFALNRSVRNTDHRAFARAAKDSKKRIKRRLQVKSSQSKVKKAIRYREVPHLTVIEGRKGKKKNRQNRAFH